MHAHTRSYHIAGYFHRGKILSTIFFLYSIQRADSPTVCSTQWIYSTCSASQHLHCERWLYATTSPRDNSVVLQCCHRVLIDSVARLSLTFKLFDDYCLPHVFVHLDMVTLNAALLSKLTVADLLLDLAGIRSKEVENKVRRRK